MNGDDKATRPNTPKVELSVRNFGPIAEADLDLRPLTVFVGPSNTGKTYLSVLIYALHRIFSGFSQFPFLRTALTVLGLELVKKLNRNEQLVKFSDLPDMINKIIQDSFNAPDIFGTELKTELQHCFDLETALELMRVTDDRCHEMIVSMKATEENQDLWHFNMRASESDTTVDRSINANPDLFPEDWLPSTPQIGFDDFLRFIYRPTSTTGERYYLPAARSGIMQSHRVIASSLVTRSTRAGLETLEIPTLSGVVADFMQKLILYEEGKTLDDSMNQIASALESDVLDGQIIMKPSPTGYPQFLYRPQGTEHDMRLTRSSSMVSELAPLVLFIRGLARPGDTLFIEEPEAHLHPAAQTEMAATLARLVRAGVRVLVTTHSDFMLKELANLMHEGELEEKGALWRQTDKLARWLSPEEVGVWLFQKNGIVDEIKFDRIHGIEPIEYEDVAEALYNRWAGLQNRIEELKDEHELECE